LEVVIGNWRAWSKAVECPDFAPRLEAAFDGIHGVAVGLPEGLAGGDAAGDGRHLGGEAAVSSWK